MSDKSKISIFIVEDETIVAMDIARRVRKLGYSVADIKHKSDEAINYLKIHKPDIVLCDINIKGEKDGIDVATFNQNNNKAPLIFITALSDASTLDRAKKSLPYGYIVKPFSNRDLLTSIELALYKHSVELERINLSNERLSNLLTEDLSERELEVLQDMVNGLTNVQIGKKRFIAISTAKFHVSNIFQKMQAKNRAEVLHKILQLIT